MKIDNPRQLLALVAVTVTLFLVSLPLMAYALWVGIVAIYHLIKQAIY